MKKIKTQEEFDAARRASAEKPSFVIFSSPTCAPCKMIKPELERIAKENGVKVYEVDVYESPKVALLNGVRSAPVVFAFNFGGVADQMVGARDTASLVEFVESQVK